MAPFEKLFFIVASCVGARVFASAVSTDPEELTVKAGDSAGLSCVDPNSAIPSVLQWVRADLQSKLSVYFYRDGHPLDQYQHESFQGRVQLKDPEMKGGNVSLILWNVTVNDTGRYECQRITSQSGRSKRGKPAVICTVNLKVEGSGLTSGNIQAEEDKDGQAEGGNGQGRVGMIVGLSVFGVMFLVVVVLLMRNRAVPSSSASL